ncbi:MAG: LPXTG cell wall anchor domain-containing protein [Bacillaceae bacterium]
MKRKLVLLSTITALVMGQSSIGFAITDEAPNVVTEEMIEGFEVTQANEENGEQQVNNQQETTTKQEKPNSNQQNANESSQLQAGQANTSETKDEEAPTLHSLKADKKEVSRGEIVKISADVQDESGVKYVSVFYRNTDSDDGRESKDTKEVQLTYNTKTKAYEGVFLVSQDITAGTWDVFTVSLGDKVGNKITYPGKDIQNKDTSFVVKKESEDDKPDFAGPVFERITANKQELNKDEAATITLKASDKSGIESIIANYIHKVTGIQRDVDFEESNKPGEFIGEFWVDEFTANGEWEISSIELIDTVGNTTYVTRTAGKPNPFTSAKITVKNASNDVTGPVVEDISVSANKGKPGDTVKVSVTAKDESEIWDVAAWFVNKDSYKEMLVMFETEDGIHFEGDFEIEEGMDNGAWELDSVTLIDAIGNETYVPGSNYPLTTITVIDGNADFIAPTIGEVIVDKKTDPLGIGDTINFSVEATDDDSGVASAFVVYERPISGIPEVIELTHNETTKRYEGQFVIEKYTEMGVWKNIGLGVMDKAGNMATQEPMVNANFTVVGTTLDEVAPVIQDVKLFSDKEVENGDVVQVNATITDDFSGVERAGAIFVNEEALDGLLEDDELEEDSPQYKALLKAKNSFMGDVFEGLIEEIANEFPEAIQYVKLHTVKGSDLFEGALTVKEEMARGEWSFGGVFAIDNADNIGGMEDEYEGLSFVVVDKTSTTPEEPEQPTKPEQPTTPEQPTNPEQPTKPEQPTVPQQPATQSPQTGDTSNVPLYSAALLVSVLGLGLLVRRRKN